MQTLPAQKKYVAVQIYTHVLLAVAIYTLAMINALKYSHGKFNPVKYTHACSEAWQNIIPKTV